MPKSSQTRWTPPVKPVMKKCPNCGTAYRYIPNQRRRCQGCDLGIVHKLENLHVADCPLIAENARSGEWIRVD